MKVAELITETSPIGQLGFPTKLVNAAYRYFKIDNTELPKKIDKITADILADGIVFGYIEHPVGDLKLFGNAEDIFFVIGKNNSSWIVNPGPYEESQITSQLFYTFSNREAIKGYVATATSTLKFLRRGQYFFVPYSSTAKDRTRQQGTTKNKRKLAIDQQQIEARDIVISQMMSRYQIYFENIIGPKIQQLLDFGYEKLRGVSLDKREHFLLHLVRAEENLLEFDKFVQVFLEKHNLWGFDPNKPNSMHRKFYSYVSAKSNPNQYVLEWMRDYYYEAAKRNIRKSLLGGLDLYSLTNNPTGLKYFNHDPLRNL